jgi:hypothetical protein
MQQNLLGLAIIRSDGGLLVGVGFLMILAVYELASGNLVVMGTPFSDAY